MSISKCERCHEVYETDYEMEVNENGDCICDVCYEVEIEIKDIMKKFDELMKQVQKIARLK